MKKEDIIGVFFHYNLTYNQAYEVSREMSKIQPTEMKIKDKSLRDELIAYTKYLFKDDTTEIDLEFVDDYLSERSEQ